MSALARKRSIFAQSTVFHYWRKLYKRGLLQAPGTTKPKLWPVHIADLPAQASLAPSPSMVTTALPTIHIDIPGKKLRSDDLTAAL